MFTKMVEKLLDWLESLHGKALAVFVIVCLVLISLLVFVIIVVTTTMNQGGIPAGMGILVIIGLVALTSIILSVLMARFMLFE